MTFVSSHHEAVVIVVVLPADDFKGQNLMPLSNWKKITDTVTVRKRRRKGN